MNKAVKMAERIINYKSNSDLSDPLHLGISHRANAETTKFGLGMQFPESVDHLSDQ